MSKTYTWERWDVTGRGRDAAHRFLDIRETDTPDPPEDDGRGPWQPVHTKEGGA